MGLMGWPVGAETMAPTGMDDAEGWDEVLVEVESCNAAEEAITTECCCAGARAAAAAEEEMASAEVRGRAKP